MTTPKDELVELLSSHADTVSVENFEYHLYVIQKTRRGFERAESEGALSHEAVKKRLSRWIAN